MISAISVKDRLRNRAAASGKTFQEALTAYGLERTVYRLSMSKYKDRFTLKGGIFLYALFDGEFARTTRDIDLLAKNIPNNVEDMRKVFECIFSIECDDALRFDLDTLDVDDITEFKEYHGVNVSVLAYLDRTKIPVSIDIGFDDIFVFTDDFLESEIHQNRWKSFLKKKKALVNVELEEVVSLLKKMMLPIVDSIASGTEYLSKWDHTSRSWI